jgi:hypothetical protein
MLLARLATVELQLIMQCCNRNSLLSLARCSHFTLSSASSDFPWKCISPLHLVFHDSDLSLGAHISGSLLRFCTIALRWIPPANGWGPSMPAMEAVANVPRLVELDASLRSLDAARLDFLGRNIARPAGLSSLALRFDLNPQRGDKIGQQLLQYHTRLTELRLISGCFSMLSTLAALPHLRSLYLADDSGSDERTIHVKDFTALLDLTLVTVFEGVLHPMLTSPSLRHLIKLHLCNIFARQAGGWDAPPSPIGFEDIFENLISLVELHLVNAYAVDEVLRAVSSHASKTVQLVTIQIDKLALEGGRVDPDFVVNQSGQQLPSEKVLTALLTAQPVLSCNVSICARTDCSEEQVQHEYADDIITLGEWDTAMLMLSLILEVFPARMKIIQRK